MVKSCLTVRVERRVTEESNWQPVGDLASTILRAAAERREKVEQFKAAAARYPGSAFQPQSDGISVQLSLPLPEIARVDREPRAPRASRL
jgi:hypothetical protein